MKFSVEISFAILAMASTQATHLYAQTAFQKAHQRVTALWQDAGKMGNNHANREAVKQEGRSLPNEVEPLLTQGVLDYLNHHAKISAEELTLSIARALAAPGIPVSTVADADGVVSVMPFQNEKAYAVAYTVSYCVSCSESWLGIFERRDQFMLTSHFNNPLANDAVHLASMGNGLAPLFVLYGVHWGDAHSRLDVRAYSSKGGLTETWSRLDLPEGTISFSDLEFTLAFRSALLAPWTEVRETYRIKGNRPILLKRATLPARP